MIIFIPKFKELISEWTRRKLRSSSVVPPKKRTTDKEEEAEEEAEEERDITPPRCPQKEIINLYHKTFPSLPKVKSWPETYEKMLRMRWREDPARQDLNKWEQFFLWIKESRFLMGENNRDWTVDLFWIVRPSNFAKIISGKYHKSNGIPNPYKEFINEGE